MALFPSEDVRPEEEASRRRSMTQETGTRRLVIGFIAILAIWLIASRVWDAYLLRRAWAPLTADTDGLTVVSTLDRRGGYDRNLFRVVQIEGDARAELTNFGWASIFSGQHGPLSQERVGNIVQGAIKLDSEAGYGMLAPFIAAEVKYEMGDASAYAALSRDEDVWTALPVTPDEKRRKRIPARSVSLGKLLDHFESEGHDARAADNHSTEGSSGSEHQVEHGLAVPGDVLVRTCPVVLISRHFSRGWVEEHPEVIMGGKTYSVWVDLTPEGRSRFYQWSRTHANEHLLLVLGGSVLANGRIKMTMDVPTWEITNLRDGDAAHKLVAYINTHGSRTR